MDSVLTPWLFQGCLYPDLSFLHHLTAFCPSHALLAQARSRVVSHDSGLLLCSNNKSRLCTHHVKENYPTHWQDRNLKQGPNNHVRENVRMLFNLTKSKLTFTKQDSGLLAPPSHYSIDGLQADWGRGMQVYDLRRIQDGGIFWSSAEWIKPRALLSDCRPPVVAFYGFILWIETISSRMLLSSGTHMVKMRGLTE